MNDPLSVMRNQCLMNSNNAGRGEREGFSIEGGSSLLTQTSKVLRSWLLKLLQWKWFNYSLKVGQNLGFIGVQRIYAVNKCNKVRTTPNNFAINYRWQWYTTALCSRNFQNMKLRLDFVDIWFFTTTQILREIQFWRT